MSITLYLSAKFRRLHGWKPLALAVLIPIMGGLALSAFKTQSEWKTLTVIVDGKAINISTTENFIGDALSDAGIEFDQNDIMLPPAMASIVDGEVVSIKRVDRKIVNREVFVPYETVILDNSRLRLMSEVELRAGMPGLRKDVVEIENIDGEVKEEVLTSKVVLEPVSRKIYRGTRVTGSTVASMEMVATAYTAGAESCWPSVDGKTAVMKKAGFGVAAVDPRVIPLGTRLYIDGYGFAIAADIGGAIKGNRIDLFLTDVKTARAFGKRKVSVHLLD